MNQIKVVPQDKLVLVNLSCSFSWGTITDKQMSERQCDETGATTGAVRVRKTLFPKGAGKRIEAVRSELSAFYSNTHSQLTFGIGLKGNRAMPTDFYMKYMERFGTAKYKSTDAMTALKDNYHSDIREAEKLLGSAFKITDYPQVEEIEEYYNFDVKFLPMPAGSHILKALGAAVAADVDEQVNDMLKTMADDAKNRLREAVTRMAKTLTAGTRIYDTMPQAVNELSELLPVIAGITEDSELKSMVQEVKDTLVGYDGDDFRNSEALQTNVGKAAMDLLKKMGA